VWVIATRFAARTALGPSDVAFARYLSASAILAPFVFRNGLGVRQAGLARSVKMACGAGPPFFVLGSTEMPFAPASAAGAVVVGSMSFFVAVLSAAIDGERLGWIRILGFLAV
jgi:hypothetical protein